jgi:hypothetical protein
MNKRTMFLFTVSWLAISNPSFCQESPSNVIRWNYGPTQAKVGKVAHLYVPKGYAYLNQGEDIRQLAEGLHNLYDPSEILLLAPLGLLNGQNTWHMGFWYDATGYVREEGQPPIDAAGILESAKQDQAAENKRLIQKGFETGEIKGWAVEPHYDVTSKNLEWAYDINWYDPSSKSNEEDVNYCEKYLGQYGVLTVSLVAEKKEFEQNYAEFREILKTLRFNEQNLRGRTRANPSEVSPITFNELVKPGFKKPTPEAATPTAALPNAPQEVKTKGSAWMWLWAVLLLLLLLLCAVVLRKKHRNRKKK